MTVLPGRHARPLVALAQSPSAIRLETGPDGGVTDFAGGPRVCVLAHWDQQGWVGRSTRALIDQLSQLGYRTLLVSTADGDEDLTWTHGRPAGVTVLRRPNLGYDFGSWATAMDRYPVIRSAALVLLVNDSMIGPFGPIDHLLDRFHRSSADVWAMTDTHQLGHHLQSYVLGFKGACLDILPLKRFWQSVRVEPSREEVIRRYELGLSRLLRREHLATNVAIEGWRAVDGDQNPTIVGWRRLLDLGFPFVKRQILRDPGICPDGADAPAELYRRFGVHVAEWL